MSTMVSRETPVSESPDAPRRRLGRVAVVLVHGMGEQRPMEDLLTFVENYAAGSGMAVHGGPDRCDVDFELHTQIAVPEARGPQNPQRDFYQGYWAPDMRGTPVSAVVGWARGLVLRSPREVAHRLLVWWWLVWVLVVASVAVGALVWWNRDRWAIGLVAAQVLILPLLTAAVSNSLGDVARYVDSHPANVAARTAVRRDVVGLLERLHDLKRYDRIIVVGHSLGGLVAYDAVSLLWSRRTADLDVADLDAEQHAIATAVDDPETPGAGDDLHAPPPPGIVGREELRRAQSRLFDKLSTATLPGTDSPAWLVSDLVTIGSPVAYPDLFMTPRGRSPEDCVAERSLATCPPAPAAAGASPSLCFVSGAIQGRGELTVFHRGAVFAATRWTNVYASRDFVGGPVDGVLGWGVDNVEFTSADDRRFGVPILSHTRYWAATGPAAKLRGTLDALLTSADADPS